MKFKELFIKSFSIFCILLLLILLYIFITEYLFHPYIAFISLSIIALLTNLFFPEKFKLRYTLITLIICLFSSLFLFSECNVINGFSGYESKCTCIGFVINLKEKDYPGKIYFTDSSHIYYCLGINAGIKVINNGY